MVGSERALGTIMDATSLRIRLADSALNDLHEIDHHSITPLLEQALSGVEKLFLRFCTSSVAGLHPAHEHGTCRSLQIHSSPLSLMKTPFLASRLSRRAILTAALLTASLSVANAIEVTGPGARSVPTITSYVPTNVVPGETLLINHTDDTPLGAMSRIEFRAANNRRVSTTLTRVSSKLYRVTVPQGAITGPTTLVSPSGVTREQPAISIVVPTLRARGISVVNMAQYQVNSVKKGATEMLPTGTVIPQGEARFLTHNFSTEPSIALDVAYFFLPPTPPPSSNPLVIRLTPAPVPVLTERLLCAMARPDVSTPAKALTAKLRRELELEALSPFDLLGASGGEAALWRVFQARRDRSVTLQGFGTTGTATISETPFTGTNPGVLPVTRQFNVSLSMSSTNPDEINMSLTTRDTNERIGPRISIPMPFDAFSTDQLGLFNRTEDDLRSDGSFADQIRIGLTPEIDRKGLPLLVRRVFR